VSEHDSIHDPLRPRLSPLDFRPHHEDRLLVKKLPQPETERGLIVPETAKKKAGPQLGLVVGVGKGRTYSTNYRTEKITRFKNGYVEPCECKVGDTVFYERSEVNEFEWEGETYTPLYEEQGILAIVEKQ
jgi:co-chaperonin GroES (HSP10)